MEGYIKLHRQITEWEWYHDANTFRVFIHLLLNANYADGMWKGIEIKRGQRFTSIASLSKELGLSQKAIRGAIEKLILTKNLASKGANNGTMITICNYDTYQSNYKTEGQTEGQSKGEQKQKKGRAEGQQTRIYKNNKEEEEIYNNDFDVYTFDEFWNDYDKKVGKDKSMIKFNRLSKDDKNKIKETIKDYVASTPDVKFRKNPETYLNNKSWNDEIVIHSNVVKKANKLDEIQNTQSSLNF